MASYVENSLIAGEAVVYTTRIHPIVFLSPALFILAGIGLGAFGIPQAGVLVLGFGDVPIEPRRAPAMIGVAKLQNSLPCRLGMTGTRREAARPERLERVGPRREGLDLRRQRQAFLELALGEAKLVTLEGHLQRPGHHGDRAIGVMARLRLARGFFQKPQHQARFGVLCD